MSSKEFTIIKRKRLAVSIINALNIKYTQQKVYSDIKRCPELD